MRPHFIILLLSLLAFVSCSRKSAQDSRQLYNEEDVRKFVLPGTPLTAIIQRFGQPLDDEKNPKFEDGSTNIDEIVYFLLPPPLPGKTEDFEFSGFQVHLKAGRAVDWLPSHRTTH
jgi:hypothetical protein